MKVKEIFLEEASFSEVFNEMIKKFKLEIDDEYIEVVRVMGLEERLIVMCGEFLKVSVEEYFMYFILIEKIEKFKEEFNICLSEVFNYESFKFKFDMLKDFLRVKVVLEVVLVKNEINKRF